MSVSFLNSHPLFLFENGENQDSLISLNHIPGRWYTAHFPCNEEVFDEKLIRKIEISITFKCDYFTIYIIHNYIYIMK